jgi:hypothetical protein
MEFRATSSLQTYFSSGVGYLSYCSGRSIDISFRSPLCLSHRVRPLFSIILNALISVLQQWAPHGASSTPASRTSSWRIKTPYVPLLFHICVLNPCLQERGGTSLTSKAANNAYQLSGIFILGFNYGTPTVFSGCVSSSLVWYLSTHRRGAQV